MDTLKKLAGPVFGLILFSVAMWFLYQKLQSITWEEFKSGLAGISTMSLVGGLALVALNYFVLIGNDLVAVEYSAGRIESEIEGEAAVSIPFRRVALASFLGYAFANNIGAVAAGIPIRARFYGSWGFRPSRIATLIAFLGLSFWVGFGAVGGVFLSLVEVPMPEDYKLSISSRILGYILLGATLGYAMLCFIWRRPLQFKNRKLWPPSPSVMLRQIIVASADLLIVCTTLYVLMPAEIAASFPEIATAYLLALALAMLTQVPGGLGVLEAVLLALLGSSMEEARIMGVLLIFRCYYYVIPLFVGAIMLMVVELRSRVKTAGGEHTESSSTA